MNTIKFSKESCDTNVNRLINQIYKLIPMRENNEDWMKQLNSVIIEIAGLAQLFSDECKLLILLSKLEGLKVVEIKFGDYRKTVFEAISILKEVSFDDR